MAKKSFLLSSFTLSLLCLAMAGVCLADEAGQTIVAAPASSAGLVAHYEFEGNADDASGLDPPAHGALVGNPAYKPGVFGQAIALDGDGDYVKCGNGSLFSLTDQLTVAAWINVNQFDKKWQTIVSKGDDSWRLARAADSNTIEFACNGTAATKWPGWGEVPWCVSGTTSVNDAKWHHVAGVFDGQTLQLYIGGVLEAAKAAAKSVDVGKYEVCIGENAQATGRQWNGYIDDLRIYNRALSHAQIVSLMGESRIDLPLPVPAKLYEVAKRYDDQKKYEEAEGLCELILQQYPDSPEADDAQVYLSKRNILSLIDSKDYTEAQQVLDSLIADFGDRPDMPEALHTIAGRYELPGKYEEAKSLYEQIVELYLDSPYAAKARFDGPEINIFYLIASKKYTEAQEEIDILTADFPKYPGLPGSLYCFAKRLDAAGQYEQARNIYQQVAWQHPKDPHATKALIQVSKVDALYLIESGDDNAVHKVLDNLIADFTDNPDLPEIVFEIGEKYYYKAFEDPRRCIIVKSQEHLNKAKHIWERIIAEWPESQSIGLRHAYYFSAACYRRLDQHEKAIEYYQKVISDWPDYAFTCIAHYFIGECYEKFKNSGSLPESEADPKIEQAYKALVEKYPDRGLAKPAALKLGRLNFQRGQWLDAAVYFELFLEKSTQNDKPTRILYQLGQTYEKMGQFDIAVEVYKQLIETADPRQALVKDVKAKLAELEGQIK